MWFVVIKFGGGGGGWSQIKPITFGNELRTYDKIPNYYAERNKLISVSPADDKLGTWCSQANCQTANK